METGLNSVTKPTFHQKLSKTHKKSKANNAVQESLSGSRRGRRPESTVRKSRRKIRGMSNQENDKVIVSQDDEKEEVERKILTLQRIVPGGESLGIDKLFEETVGYILTLECQIKAMRFLESFLEEMEKEKRKFGG